MYVASPTIPHIRLCSACSSVQWRAANVGAGFVGGEEGGLAVDHPQIRDWQTTVEFLPEAPPIVATDCQS